MILFVSLLALLAWIYLMGFHGRFWRSSPVLDPDVPSGRAKVVAIVPARNEAESIRRSLSSLVAQNYPGDFSIILIDDNSTDGTGEIAASLAGGGRLKIIVGLPLPPGWTGKLWAVNQGLNQDEANAADFVLLTDADIVHAPGHLSALVAKAEADSLDLTSEMVQLHCRTAAERALIPAFVFFFQMLYPFDWVADPRKPFAGAAGGTMLVSRRALDRIDGVSRIRGDLIDDCALARQIKSTGGSLWLGHTADAVSIRRYPRWHEVWDMIARTAYVQLRQSPLLLLGCILAMGLIFLAPPLLSFFARGLMRWLGVLSWLIMTIVFQPTLRRYRRTPLWGMALPAVSLFYLAATIASAVRHYTGRGGGWKNRVYPSMV